tara:strand:- start:273 stop:554 length:282 start_codon:yes stop_codon:yes gene_type:complete
MNRFDDLRVLLNRILNREKPYKREMKRVFQWKRYLQWKDLTTEEKISAKRFLLVPVFAYVILSFFDQNLLLIILFLIGYALYKKYEKGGIIKK